MKHATQLPVSVVHDLTSSLLGEKLGHGMSREVYVWAPNDKLVLKLETDANERFQNVTEWNTWHALKETKHSGWLAPCVWISRCGTALLMHRTAPMGPGQEPLRLPGWLTDHKRGNYGVLLDRVVCHDYGTSALLNHGAFGRGVKTLKREDWW